MFSHTGMCHLSACLFIDFFILSIGMVLKKRCSNHATVVKSHAYIPRAEGGGGGRTRGFDLPLNLKGIKGKYG